MPAASEDRSTIAAFLRARTEVVDPMFAQFNLRLVSYNFKIRPDYGIELVFEIAALEGPSLRVCEDSCGVLVKANLYDESGSILDSASSSVSSDGFSGYDTGEIWFFDEGIALAADSVRLFVANWG